jgi:phosphopentomutase
MAKIKRVILVVMDSVGVGELPDAAEYGDRGANTLGNAARAVGGLSLPNLESLGLGQLVSLRSGDYKIGDPRPAATSPLMGSYGKMAELAKGKDTTTGHWEMMGVVVDRGFPTYPDGFPADLLGAFEKAIGRKTLGNKTASGTEIIKELGEEHCRTGSPIVYTSADSVFQVAAHEEIIPLEELYRICKVARGLLTGPHAVGRVIARPFVGKPGSFARTHHRHDYSLEPFSETLLDRIKAAGLPCVSVGKIWDIFAGRGLTQHLAASPNAEVMRRTLEGVKDPALDGGLLFADPAHLPRETAVDLGAVHLQRHHEHGAPRCRIGSARRRNHRLPCEGRFPCTSLAAEEVELPVEDAAERVRVRRVVGRRSRA